MLLGPRSTHEVVTTVTVCLRRYALKGLPYWMEHVGVYHASLMLYTKTASVGHSADAAEKSVKETDQTYSQVFLIEFVLPGFVFQVICVSLCSLSKRPISVWDENRKPFRTKWFFLVSFKVY